MPLAVQGVRGFDVDELMRTVMQGAQPAAGGSIADQLRARTRQRAQASRTSREGMMDALVAMSSRRAQAAGGGGGGGVGGGGASTASSVNLPHGKGLTTITAPNGQKVTVSATYAAKFQGLLGDLWNAGYKFKSVGGYNYRNIAGTKTLSRHAFGEAIDIDPQPNRGGRLGGGGGKYGYFNPAQVNALARKWGLDWGANWSNPDPMHFSTGG